jgi:cold shock protein
MSARRTGRVKWFCASRGYGFLEDTAGGPDAFVHFSNLKRKQEGWKALYKGEYVSYIPQLIEDQTSALEVTGVDGGRLMCEADDWVPSVPPTASC